MKLKKLLCLSLAIVSAVSFSACGDTKKQGKNANLDLSASKYGDTYPVTSDKTLSIWGNYALDAQYTKLEDMPMFQELSKRTGIKAEYKIPTGSHLEQFNLLIASGDYPDIIMYDWFNCMGNPSKPIEDNVIIPLNDVFEAYAPNLTKYLEENSEYAKNYKDDEGRYYGFPSLDEFKAENYQTMRIFQGPIINETLLKQNNLEKPETIDEWYQVLTTLKNSGVKYPVTLEGKALSYGGLSSFVFGAFNTCYNYYIKDDGKVTYGPLEPEFKSALQELNKWYQEGLLDKEFASNDGALIERKMADGSAASCVGYVSRISKWSNDNNAYTFAGAQYPVMNKGDKPEFGQVAVNGSGSYAAITTQCSDVELAARYLDYAYTEEGIRLCNYGIEGVTYNMVDGVEVLTDEILNNFEKINPYSTTLCSVHMINRYNQRNRLPSQQAALSIWQSNMDSHSLPAITPTVEESNEMAEYNSELVAYSDEMILKYIAGYESLDTYDSFVENLKSLGVEKVIASKQNQLERYRNR